jgi:phenylacetate-CoA ligase
VELLIKQLKYTVEHSNFYHPKKMDYASIYDSQFTLSDFEKLPFTSKDEFSLNNEKFLAVSSKKIAEYSTTSGTSGSPVTIYLTKHDLRRLAKNEYDSLKLMGFSTKDVFQLMTTIDKQFMAGLAYYLGVQKLSAGIIRTGPGAIESQINAILKYKPTVLIAVPSFITNIIEFANQHQIDLNSTSVKSIICIGESIRNQDFSLNVLGHKISTSWDVSLFSTYASTEIGVAFSECNQHHGNHVNEELAYVEVINEETKKPVKEGEIGEIVVTPLNITGTPLIRYKTGDLAKAYYKKCECGLTSLRIGPIIGRKNQMIKYRGTTIYPNAIFEILENFSSIQLYKVEITKDEFENDQIHILINTTDEYILDDLNRKFKSLLKVSPKISLLEKEKLFNLVHTKNSRKPLKIEFI